MESLPLPTSLDEVTELIRNLYRPNPPEIISRIQEVLQRLQKSPEGWQLAQGLIQSSEDNIRFYAALTIIVKLNRDSASLSEDDATVLLENLIGWTLLSVDQGAGAFVTKKLCSALVTYFIHFSHLWPSCARHFFYCLDLGRGTTAGSLDDALTTSMVIEKLNSPKLRVALWFAASLVEEVGKTDLNASKYVQVHERLVKNAPDVACLLSRGFESSTGDGTPDIRAETLSCFQAWILYAQRAPHGISRQLVEHLQGLVSPALNCFADPSLFQATADLFGDVLSNYSTFFTEAQYSDLAALFDSPWAAEHYERLLHGNHEEDGISFGLLMLAYGDARVQDLMTSTDARSQSFLGRLSGLLAADGYLIGNDAIFVPALEFWSTFLETMIDCSYSGEDGVGQWRPFADQHLKAVVTNSWRKVQWPPVDEFAQWDSTERVAFADARKDVADMLQSVFTLNGVTLVAFFADLFLTSLSIRSWPELEASAFCLGALSDCVTNEDRYDAELSKVFASPFFELLSETQGAIPIRLRQTGLLLIERYCEYFERHAEFLPNALNLLFAAVGDPVLGGPSARSISTLCSSCRSLLTSEAGAFVRHYRTIRSNQVLDSLAEEKIVLAISSIIQAIPDEEPRLQLFEELYGMLKMDFELAVRLRQQPTILNLSNPDFLRGLDPPTANRAVPPVDEISLQMALRSMRCLGSMAKGMQDVQEHPVDIDGGVPPLSPDSKLPSLQVDILGVLVEVQRAFPNSGEVIEIICNVLRAGFSETEPGPFVFPAYAVTAYFVQQPSETPRLGTLLSTACSFVGSLYRGPKALVSDQLVRLLPWAISLLQALPEPESDTEISQNGICFVDKVMSRYPEAVFQLPEQTLEFFFFFSLKVLGGKEPLPKNASADFWSGFISLKPEDPALQATVASAIEYLGPLVSRTLIQNVGGNAARSELDRISDPLKKLISQQVRAQQWLQAALFDQEFPSTHVTDEDKMAFLRKILGLRGARATNHVVREFWLACRGSNFAYAS